MNKAWEEFLKLTEEEPGAWLLYRDFMTGGTVLEFFDSDHYSGQLEVGTGDWHVSGTLEAVVAHAGRRYQEILKRRAEKTLEEIAQAEAELKMPDQKEPGKA